MNKKVIKYLSLRNTIYTILPCFLFLRFFSFLNHRVFFAGDFFDMGGISYLVEDNGFYLISIIFVLTFFGLRAFTKNQLDKSKDLSSSNYKKSLVAGIIFLSVVLFGFAILNQSRQFFYSINDFVWEVLITIIDRICIYILPFVILYVIWSIMIKAFLKSKIINNDGVEKLASIISEDNKEKIKKTGITFERTIKGLILSVSLLVVEFLPYFSCHATEDSEEGIIDLGTSYLSVIKTPLCWIFVIITIVLIASFYNNYKLLTSIDNNSGNKKSLFKSIKGNGFLMACNVFLLLAPLTMIFVEGFADWASDESGTNLYCSNSIAYYLYPLLLAVLLIYNFKSIIISYKAKQNNHE